MAIDPEMLSMAIFSTFRNIGKGCAAREDRCYEAARSYLAQGRDFADLVAGHVESEDADFARGMRLLSTACDVVERRLPPDGEGVSMSAYPTPAGGMDCASHATILYAEQGNLQEAFPAALQALDSNGADISGLSR